MALIKCKMCGGDLNLIEGASTAECEYCGSVQTVPKVDDEKKLTLFSRANRLRAACEFDKAAGIYESIVADFPEEAEAFWGLVLCKYGIEYVDDPATGKKIPTCHRSSFDSIMADSDFEQALENADLMARRVYREEAKQIEEIRKGIIAVSNNEQPYDIFICYKETAESGDRTLDSVLAQDIYDALTEKGYRVFFARITLEDKLGMEYEPYIFAALNSARIMLAVGTDYEYFNAVWVKNEWSRYLKLMARDKSKHLIPCFKGIDAYDMPKEFARLQAQDLGKVGAIQDLLRGIEKLMPRQQTEAVAVSTPPANDATAPLLRRMFMFLEEGKWNEADTYCERVLDLNPECAQAYLGKLMAQLKVKTKSQLENEKSAIGGYENFRKALRYADPELRTFLENAGKRITDRLEQERLSAAYQKAVQAMGQAKTMAQFNLVGEQFRKLGSYQDAAEKAKQCATAAERARKSDIYVNACRKMAVARETRNTFPERIRVAQEAAAMFGTVADFMDAKSMKDSAEKLAKELREEAQAQQLRKEEAEAARKDSILTDIQNYVNGNGQTAEGYRKHYNLANSIAGWKNADALAAVCKEKEKELEYAQLVQDAKADHDVEGWDQLLRGFERLGDYEDSKNLAEHCRKRKADAQAALEAEAERLRLLKEKEEAERKAKAKRNRIIAVSVACVVTLGIVFVYLLNTVIIPTQNYNEALAQMEAGNYAAATEMFAALNGFKDSTDKIKECELAIQEEIYQQAMALAASNQYQDACRLFLTISDYRDSKSQATEVRYQEGLYFWRKKEYEISNPIFENLGAYKDSQDRIHTHTYTSTVEKAPQCEMEGMTRYSCENCAHSYTSAIAPVGHRYSGVMTVEPGCETEGVQTFQCADCTATYTEPVAPTGHSRNEGTITKKPGCESTGEKTFACNHCNQLFTESISATGHTYNKGLITTKPGCNTKGIKTFQCVNCSNSYTESVPATGHIYDEGTITTQAGCKTQGVIKYTCTGCDDFYTKTLDPLGHNYAAATCTKGGKCSRCDSMTSPLGHTTQTGTCNRCNYNFTPKQTITGGFCMTGGKVDLSLSKGRYSVTVILEDTSKYETCRVNLYYFTKTFDIVDIYDKDIRTDGTSTFEFEMTQDCSDFYVSCDRYGLIWTFIIEPIN